MASRIAEQARKKKLTEQAAAEGSVLRRKAVREQVSAPRGSRIAANAAPADDVAESAPVSPPQPTNLSDALKQTLFQGSTAGLKNAQSSVLDPPREPIIPSSIASATTYNPETERHSVEVKSNETVHSNITGALPQAPVVASNPREEVPPAPITSVLPDVPMIQKYEYVYDPITKTRTKQLVSKPATISAAQAQQIEQAVKDRLVKLSSETQEQYEVRLARVIAQDKDFALKGVSVADRQKAISDEAAKHVADLAKFTMSEDERVRTQAAMKERQELIEKLGLDPNVKYSQSYLDAIKARQEDPFTPIVQGLTDVADVVVGHILPLAGPLGGVVAQAYKSFAPPTSKFYTDQEFGNKVVDFLVDNVQDKAKDLAMGQLKSVVGAAGNIAKGYRIVGKETGSTVGDKLAGSFARQADTTQMVGGRSFPAGSNIRGTLPVPSPSGPAIGGLPRVRDAPVPRAFNVQRNDVILSPRGVAPPAPRR
jgi:hypothetical protein